MQGEHAVGRVIARPFAGEPGLFARTSGRRDFALAPPGRSYLEEVQDAGVPVHAVGKVAQVFSGIGIDEAHAGPDNPTALAATTRLVRRARGGPRVRQPRRHRPALRAPPGRRGLPRGAARDRRARSPAGWRRWTPSATCSSSPPTTAATHARPGTDHTREHAPLLAWFAGHGGRRHDGPMADVGASALRWLTGGDAPLPGSRSPVRRVGAARGRLVLAGCGDRPRRRAPDQGHARQAGRRAGAARGAGPAGRARHPPRPRPRRARRPLRDRRRRGRGARARSCGSGSPTACAASPARSARRARSRWSAAAGRWRVSRERSRRQRAPWEVGRYRRVTSPHFVIWAPESMDPRRAG